MDEHQLKRLEILEERLHDHIEHYASNNKTLALLQQRMDYFIQRFEKHDEKEVEYNKRVDEHLSRLATIDIDQAKTILDGYRSILTMRNLVIGLAAFAVAVGTVGAFVISLIKYLKA